jgi:hypothetical protein
LVDEIRRMTPQSTRLWLVLGAFLAGLALCFGVIALIAGPRSSAPVFQACWTRTGNRSPTRT